MVAVMGGGWGRVCVCMRLCVFCYCPGVTRSQIMPCVILSSAFHLAPTLTDTTAVVR